MRFRNVIDAIPIATRGPRNFQVRNYVGSEDSYVSYQSSKYGYDSQCGSEKNYTEISTFDWNQYEVNSDESTETPAEVEAVLLKVKTVSHDFHLFRSLNN